MRTNSSLTLARITIASFAAYADLSQPGSFEVMQIFLHAFEVFVIYELNTYNDVCVDFFQWHNL